MICPGRVNKISCPVVSGFRKRCGDFNADQTAKSRADSRPVLIISRANGERVYPEMCFCT